jgi:hypothetical protein
VGIAKSVEFQKHSVLQIANQTVYPHTISLSFLFFGFNIFNLINYILTVITKQRFLFKELSFGNGLKIYAHK